MGLADGTLRALGNIVVTTSRCLWLSLGSNSALRKHCLSACQCGTGMRCLWHACRLLYQTTKCRAYANISITSEVYLELALVPGSLVGKRECLVVQYFRRSIMVARRTVHCWLCLAGALADNHAGRAYGRVLTGR